MNSMLYETPLDSFSNSKVAFVKNMTLWNSLHYKISHFFHNIFWRKKIFLLFFLNENFIFILLRTLVTSYFPKIHFLKLFFFHCFESPRHAWRKKNEAEHKFFFTKPTFFFFFAILFFWGYVYILYFWNNLYEKINPPFSTLPLSVSGQKNRPEKFQKIGFFLLFF